MTFTRNEKDENIRRQFRHLQFLHTGTDLCSIISAFIIRISLALVNRNVALILQLNQSLHKIVSHQVCLLAMFNCLLHDGENKFLNVIVDGLQLEFVEELFAEEVEEGSNAVFEIWLEEFCSHSSEDVIRFVNTIVLDAEGHR